MAYDSNVLRRATQRLSEERRLREETAVRLAPAEDFTKEDGHAEN